MKQITLLITTGNGPEECCFAAQMCLQLMTENCAEMDVEIDATQTPSKHGIKSAIVVLSGANSERLCQAWLGTIQWTCPSPFRKSHRRQNWFVGVKIIPQRNTLAPDLTNADIRFDTFRAGGPGGQHQNTTDSAVRATHLPTGTSVISRSARSQHRNKAQALGKLAALFAAMDSISQDQNRQDTHEFHQTLERGNPKRHFKGRKFKEVPV